MADGFTVRGVPHSIGSDGWWLSAAAGAAEGGPPAAGQGARAGRRRPPLLLGLLALLVAAADRLFYGHPAGASLAVFALLLVLAARATRQEPPSRADLPAAALALLAVAPVLEAVQELSLVALVAGTAFAAARAALGPVPRDALLAATLRLAAMLPFRAAVDAFEAGRRLDGIGERRLPGRLLRAWGFPLVAGGGFAILLTRANPILSRWLADLAAAIPDIDAALERLIFWAVAAALAWPVLVLARERGFGLSLAPPALAPGRIGLNPVSAANALGLFNLIFAVQSLLDLAYLWGGASLPEGMSYAGYAHRGAYPLVATALLAGAFALAARPFTDHSPVLRALLLLWIAQNVLLVLSSLYRLELYVEAYGLTYLRLRAAVWMGLVAAGLALVLWQVLARRDNRWLLARTLVLAGATIYAGLFVNFAHVVAATNLAAAREGRGAPLDVPYLCALGPAAAPALRRHALEGGQRLCTSSAARAPRIEGWRDWGFRKARIRRYLSHHPLPAGASL